jgi:endo-beta-N-acetylglucosaminidase D
MATNKPRKNFFQIFTSDILLGSLVAVLGILTAIAGYQSAMADSEQTRYNVQGQQTLTDANAEYLAANQLIVYDYTMYDGWYTAESEEKAAYYQDSFSEELQTSVATLSNEEADPFTQEYYDAMYTEANGMFDEADNLFDLAEQFNERGDILQLVMLISAIGLAFAAWASLLKEENKMRVFFALFSIAMLVYAIIVYIGVPVVTV